MEVREDQAVEPEAHHAARDAHRSGHPSPKEYIRIGVILAVLTGLEVTASYSGVTGSILIPTLFVLALVKFALVVLWFMHLKFDDRRYARFFVTGLSGAIALYLIVLISLRVFLR
jgi:cytochrome c oxidase subunit 4